VTDLLRRVWGWIVAVLGSVLLVVALLWRRALGQRDTARRERDDAQERAEVAAASARRGEALRDAEAVAVREREAAVKELDDRQRRLDAARDDDEARAVEARAEVWDARTDAELARIVDERRGAGRLP